MCVCYFEVGVVDLVPRITTGRHKRLAARVWGLERLTTLQSQRLVASSF